MAGHTRRRRPRHIGVLTAALWSVVAGPALAQVPAFSLEAQQRLRAASPADTALAVSERARLVALGEARLAAGDTAAAQEAFEHAASMVHAADVELGLVRTFMQAGTYRRALAFAAHTAGAHAEVGMGSALYAWLLLIGGQEAASRQQLTLGLQRLPTDPALVRVQSMADGVASDAVTPFEQQLGPYAQGVTPAVHARVASSGILITRGTRAIVPSSAVEATGPVWLRDGLGRTRRATLLRHDLELGLSLLRVDDPFEVTTELRLPAQDAFAGSPALLVAYGGATTGQAQWPRMTLGFLGRPLPGSDRRLLGFKPPDRAQGGPVFDTQGRWVGMATPTRNGLIHFIPTSAARGLWREADAVGETPAISAPAAAAAPGFDEIYERALPLTVQVIAAPETATSTH